MHGCLGRSASPIKHMQHVNPSVLSEELGRRTVTDSAQVSKDDRRPFQRGEAPELAQTP